MPYIGHFVAMPPLAEQRRGVDKVNELMALFRRLEASLTTTATHRRLFVALLAESRAAANARTMGAA